MESEREYIIGNSLAVVNLLLHHNESPILLISLSILHIT